MVESQVSKLLTASLFSFFLFGYFISFLPFSVPGSQQIFVFEIFPDEFLPNTSHTLTHSHTHTREGEREREREREREMVSAVNTLYQIKYSTNSLSRIKYGGLFLNNNNDNHSGDK